MEEETATMKPWEQHHAIISMPRYAYNPASLMQQSAGFLVTCTFRREKSATKEILTLIQEYMKLNEKDFRQHYPVSNGTEKNAQIDSQPADVEQAPPGSSHSGPNDELNLSSEDLKVLETREIAEGFIAKEAESFATIDRRKDNSPDGVEALRENSKMVETGLGNSTKDSIRENAGSFDLTDKQDREALDDEEGQGFAQSGQVHNAREVNSLKENSQNWETDDRVKEEAEPSTCEAEDKEKQDEDPASAQSRGSGLHGEEATALSAVGNDFILVKLATMGVIYICACGKPPSTVLKVASRLLKDVQAGTKAAPQWCHRLVPVQATCSTSREDLLAVVSRLVKDHLRDHDIPSSGHLLEYAVAFNRRGAADVAKDPSKESFVLGRDECIKIVTAAVEEVVELVRVDLTSPEMVVSVELIRVAGPQSCLMCAVSVLPGDLTISKPKLNIKPLAPLHPKSRKRKQPK